MGPWLAGAAYDAFGAYDVPIIAGAAFAFVAAMFALPLAKSEKAEIVHRG
jgi:cyanate permease